MMKSKDNSMTEGPIFKRLISFALLLMAVNLLQVFYNSADMMIVGMSAEADAVGQTAITFVGQNAGARRYDRIGKIRIFSYLSTFWWRI